MPGMLVICIEMILFRALISLNLFISFLLGWMKLKKSMIVLAAKCPPLNMLVRSDGEN